MRIRMNTLAASEAGVLHPNNLYEVPEKVGRDMVAGAYAVEVNAAGVAIERPPPATAAPARSSAPLERATLVPPEDAGGRGGSSSRKKKKGR